MKLPSGVSWKSTNGGSTVAWIIFFPSPSMMQAQHSIGPCNPRASTSFLIKTSRSNIYESNYLECSERRDGDGRRVEGGYPGWQHLRPYLSRLSVDAV